MNFYNYLKINSLIKNPRLKFLGLYLLHIFNRRYLSVNFDPVNACNLRCKMCYFTDKEYVKKLKGVFNPTELDLLGKAILNRALKLQIGCGTEPTLYKDLERIFKLANTYKVPYISLTTNANLLKKEEIETWAKLGLNEITISLHGIYKESYTEMMGKGSYEKFIDSLQYISEVKKKYPTLKLRVNYTFNEDNFDELKDFWTVFNEYDIDVLQIRPIKKIGNTAYTNFSLENIIPKYEATYAILLKDAKKRETTFIAPTKKQLTHKSSPNSILQSFTYCYISPTYFWRDDFSWKTETYNQYSRRKKLSKTLIKKVVASKKEYKAMENKTLNYDVT